jgi:hypothetical protein
MDMEIDNMDTKTSRILEGEILTQCGYNSPGNDWSRENDIYQSPGNIGFRSPGYNKYNKKTSVKRMTSHNNFTIERERQNNMDTIKSIMDIRIKGTIEQHGYETQGSTI